MLKLLVKWGEWGEFIIKKSIKYLKLLMFLGILLLAVGCSNSGETDNNSNGNDEESQSKGEENVQAVLENLFTGPSEEQEELMTGNVENLGEKLNEYRQENFEPHLSESFFEKFVNTNGPLMFLLIAQPNYVMEVEEIVIEEDGSDYNFTVTVAYTDQESEETKTIDVEGTAYTNEQGELTSIEYMNVDEFRSAMEQ
ncbi:hypothetical protein [Salimicrobium salexigens]|uniref:Uncharacterized protein n=1 Tax=Salimicrobium salexigens TaxID=908941 RepID=A0ABY1KQX8_9BACI|nr:hypothetical protein [Salimicrobium salexigens]SIS66831.1 hypothetical protein SAMN05421758_103280 [Salimicrobium salexigens]